MDRMKYWLIFALLATCGVAHAKNFRVVVAKVTAPGNEKKLIGKYQRALRKRDGIDIQSTRGFETEASRRSLLDALPIDNVGLTKICVALDVDAAIYARLDRPQRAKRRSDRVLILTVYSGHTGNIVGEHSIKVRRGKLTSRVWADAAKIVEPDIRRVMAPPPPPVEPVARVERRDDRRSDRSSEPIPFSEVGDLSEPADNGPISRPPTARLHAGLALLQRTFKYTAADNSPSFTEGGISYESALVPGLALDAELFPAATLTRSFARGFGIGVLFEKVFVTTQQQSTIGGEQKIVTLDTSHQHFLIRLLYEHHFGQGPTAIRAGGQFGWGSLSFEVEENDEYTGATYSYFDLGVFGYVPLGTPLAALDVRFSFLPTADHGDSAEELGENVVTTGLRIYGGLGSEIGDGLSLRLGVDYTTLGSEITGVGRGGRIGKSADDTYLGVRALAGYRF